MKKRILLGISGGVDSSVSAILLKQQGYEVVAVTMKLIEENFDEEDAKKICDLLKIEHFIVDLSKEFKNCVINDFINSYSSCKTPNPCIECNKWLKFGKMFELAEKYNCDYIATGHYAKIEYDENYNRYVLKKSESINKDQSYVLYGIDKEKLNKIIFPLSEFKTKDEIRKIALENNLPVHNKPDSEDICFVPDGDYKKFLIENSEIKEKIGNIVDSKGNILGKHKGIFNYTIGQRRGLGIAYKVPLFVLGFNKEKNEVIVGIEEELYKKEVYVSNINVLLEEEFESGNKFIVKLRYTNKEAEGILEILDENNIKIIFETPQRGVTPGQSAVMYKNDIVVAGGKIVK